MADLYSFIKLGIKGYQGKTKTKSEGVLEQRVKNRDNLLNARRKMDDLSPTTPAQKKEMKTKENKNEPTRLEMLRAWQKQRDEKLLLAKQKQKPRFQVTHATLETNLEKVYKNIKGVPIKISKKNTTPAVYKFAASTHKFKPPINIQPIEFNTNQKKVKAKMVLNFKDEPKKEGGNEANKTDRVLRSRQNRSNTINVKNSSVQKDESFLKPAPPLGGKNRKTQGKTLPPNPKSEKMSKSAMKSVTLKVPLKAASKNNKRKSLRRSQKFDEIPVQEKSITKTKRKIASTKLMEGVEVIHSPHKSNNLKLPTNKTTKTKQKNTHTITSGELDDIPENPKTDDQSSTQEVIYNPPKINSLKLAFDAPVDEIKTNRTKRKTWNATTTWKSSDELFEDQPSTSTQEVKPTSKPKQKTASIKFMEGKEEIHSPAKINKLKSPVAKTPIEMKRRSMRKKWGDQLVEAPQIPITEDQPSTSGIKKSKRKTGPINFIEGIEELHSPPKTYKSIDTICSPIKSSTSRKSSLFKTPQDNKIKLRNRKDTPGLVRKKDIFSEDRSYGTDEEYFSAPETKESMEPSSLWNSCIDSPKNKTGILSEVPNNEVEMETNKSLEDTSELNTTPINNTSITYISPFVTMSRGKKSARKEYKSRMSTGGFSAKSPHSTSNKAGSEYFSLILKKEVNRIQDMCDEWENYKNDEDVPEEAQSMINVAIGQSQLLLKKRLTQFKNMIDSCVLQNTTPVITCSDLHGYWESLLIQVTNIDGRFENLSRLKDNSWEEIIPEKKEIIVKKKPVHKAKATKSTKATTSTSLRDAIRAAKERKKLGNVKENDIEINTPGKSKSNLLQTAVMNTRTRRSASVGSPGLFMIQAAQVSKIVTPSKSILKTTASASSKRKSKAVAFRNSLITSAINKENETLSKTKVPVLSPRKLRGSKLF